VSNHLPVKASRENEDADWNFELDIDALVVQAKARHLALGPSSVCCTPSTEISASLAGRGCNALLTASLDTSSRLSANRVLTVTPTPETPGASCITTASAGVPSSMGVPGRAEDLGQAHSSAFSRQEGIDEEYQIMYVGSLSVEIDPMDQDVRAPLLLSQCHCARWPAVAA